MFAAAAQPRCLQGQLPGHAPRSMAPPGRPSLHRLPARRHSSCLPVQAASARFEEDTHSVDGWEGCMQLGACAASRVTALHELRAALRKQDLPHGVSSGSAALCCIQHSFRFKGRPHGVTRKACPYIWSELQGSAALDSHSSLLQGCLTWGEQLHPPLLYTSLLGWAAQAW